ncbi:hypothetical protein [Methylocella silvestris]|uniref:hypothetical protein n=1 Tax=Methylocella silvestris TaxID=199596 RepID=UPI0011AFB60F|nr:hypothetical protein [Methylocella silvestris]
MIGDPPSKAGLIEASRLFYAALTAFGTALRSREGIDGWSGGALLALDCRKMRLLLRLCLEQIAGNQDNDKIKRLRKISGGIE